MGGLAVVGPPRWQIARLNAMVQETLDVQLQKVKGCEDATVLLCSGVSIHRSPRIVLLGLCSAVVLHDNVEAPRLRESYNYMQSERAQLK